MYGEVSDFKTTPFYNALSKLSNSTVSRFSTISIRSGSVIADVKISPPPVRSVNEGSAERVAQILATKSTADYNDVGIDLIDNPVSPIPPDNGLSVGVIVAIVCSITVAVILFVIIIAFIFVRR